MRYLLAILAVGALALGVAGCGSAVTASPSPSEPAPGSPLVVEEESYISAITSRADDLNSNLTDGTTGLDSWPDATDAQERKAVEGRSRLQAMSEARPWGDAPTERLAGLEVAWEAAVSEAKNAVSAYVLSIQSDDQSVSDGQLSACTAAISRVSERLTEVNAIIDELRRN